MPTKPSTVDDLIGLLETDLMVEDGSVGGRPPARLPAVPRYDVLASLGYLVAAQASAGADDRRALEVLQTVVSAWLSQEGDAGTADYHHQVAAGLTALQRLPPQESIDALFGS